MLLPTDVSTLLSLLQVKKIEVVSVRATNKKDHYELLVRVKP